MKEIEEIVAIEREGRRLGSKEAIDEVRAWVETRQVEISPDSSLPVKAHDLELKYMLKMLERKLDEMSS